jgi:hypothetical protein
MERERARMGCWGWGFRSKANPTQPPSVIAQETPPPLAVTVSNAASLRAAVTSAKPGTRILLAAGTYPGGFFFPNVRGQKGLPIVFAAADPQNPPVILGGSTGTQSSAPEWVELQHLVFAGATGNGLNLDDGGSSETPARHIVLRGLRIAAVGPQGNRDGIKLSGIVDFRVESCTVERRGTGGSAIDMVGCRQGVIEGNLFHHTPAAASTGANGVQTKGGSCNVIIRRNRVEHVGARGVNLGGRTGLAYSRPPLQAAGEHWEAKDIRVEGNTFIGSTAPVAFVRVDGAVVRFNTFYRPERWAVRILQENITAGFVPCRNGLFADDLVASHSTQWVTGGVNLGPNTAPATFQSARNWWYCLDDPARSRPTLSVAETGGVYGQPPQFREAANGDVRLQPDSPARGVGAEAPPKASQPTTQSQLLHTPCQTSTPLPLRRVFSPWLAAPTHRACSPSLTPPRNGDNSAGRTAKPSAAAKDCQRPGARLRTSPGRPPCQGQALRAPSSLATGFISPATAATPCPARRART